MSGEHRRMVILGAIGAVGLLLAGWASYGPFLWWTCCHPLVTPFSQAWALLGGVLWVAVMLIAYRRDPAGPMWMLVLLLLAARGMWDLGYIPTDLTWSLGELLATLPQVVLVHLVLAFPTGRLSNAFDRIFSRLTYAFYFASSASQAVFRDPQFEGFGFNPRNVFALWPNNDVADVIGRAAFAGVPVIAGVLLWRLGRRWRTATPSGRRALGPLVLAVPFVAAILTTWHLAGVIDRDEIRVFLLNPVFALPELIIPGGFLIGIIRSRLIRGSVADLAVKLGRGVPLGGLRQLLASTLRDPTLELVFPAPAGEGLVNAAGQPVSLPREGAARALTRLEQDGNLVALLIHDPGLESETPGFVEAVGSVARLALANERLAAQVRAQLDEVRASRARIVEAADAERRRIERDLHDGAQQRLVALAMRLQTARTTAVESSELIDEATAELEEAVAEVRDLARGLHPPILTELGLGPALEALAERTKVPVRVRATERRYARAIEAAAYFVVAEALTNMARHSSASAATVTITDDGAQLVLEIADDGIGGASEVGGSGLRGLGDRVAAHGGKLEILSPGGGGTVITASLPLA